MGTIFQAIEDAKHNFRPAKRRQGFTGDLDISAGGPGSGRKPTWGKNTANHDKLDKLHKQLDNKGLKYSLSSTNQDKTMTVHHYIARDDMGNATKQADIRERSNGYHNITGLN